VADQYNAASTPCSLAAVRPGATSEVQMGSPSGRITAWMLPPKPRCFPEYQRWIVWPFTPVVVWAQRSVRNTFPSRITCVQPCPAVSVSASCRSGARGGVQDADGLVAVAVGGCPRHPERRGEHGHLLALAVPHQRQQRPIPAGQHPGTGAGSPPAAFGAQ
jgi:hypothetical protein